MRKLKNWLDSYVEYAAIGEAPKIMHFWAGVSVLAAACQRRVWFDQGLFQWYPNFYIVFVGPAGVITKSTTMRLGIDLLKKVPGIKFGPDSVTWQSLVTEFSRAKTTLEGHGDDGTDYKYCYLTFAISEFGNFFKLDDVDMVNLLVDFWDGADQVFWKSTKNNGSDEVVNPIINLLACVTPSGIEQSFPRYMSEGGFVSRCLFIYADKKERVIAYPKINAKRMDTDLKDSRKELREDLVADLQHISTSLFGEFSITPEAIEFGESWYKRHVDHLTNTPLTGSWASYESRKQTHLHKLAMILSISESDNMVIERHHLETALEYLEKIEPGFNRVYSRIEKNPLTLNGEKLIEIVDKLGEVPYETFKVLASKMLRGVVDIPELIQMLVRRREIGMRTEEGVKTIYSLKEKDDGDGV